MKTQQRFFIKNFIKADTYILDDKELVPQCYKVLRLKVEDFIIFFNDRDSTDYFYQISEIDKNKLKLNYKEEYIKNVSKSNIHIYQAIPNKLSKIEYIVQKCSEVWVNTITFFKAKRSQDSKFLTEKKIERLKKIVVESSEQANRNTVLQLEFENTLDFSTVEKENLLCFHTTPKGSLKLKNTDINKEKPIALFIWPEWWFDTSEIQKLEKIKAQFVYLWDNILRTETTWSVASFYIIQNTM